MSELIIWHAGDKSVIEDPGFADVLLNTNKVTVDGTIYRDVAQVTYND